MKRILLCLFFTLNLFTLTAYAKTSAYSTLEISDDDFANACKVGYAEGNNQTRDAQMANYEVMLNRLLHKYRGSKTLTSVLCKPGEFAGWDNNSYCTQQQVDLLDEVLAGKSGLKDYVNFSKEMGYIDKDINTTDYLFFCTLPSYKAVGYKYMYNCVFIDGHVYGTMEKVEQYE